MTAIVNWPLGKEADGVYLFFGEDADLVVPLFDGVPSPEEGDRRFVPAGVPSPEVDPDQVAEELAQGPSDVWVVAPRTDEVERFFLALTAALEERGVTSPAPAFLPHPLTVPDLIAELPTGRDALNPGRPSRTYLFMSVVRLSFVANAPDEWLVPFFQGQIRAAYYDEVLG